MLVARESTLPATTQLHALFKQKKKKQSTWGAYAWLITCVAEAEALLSGFEEHDVII